MSIAIELELIILLKRSKRILFVHQHGFWGEERGEGLHFLSSMIDVFSGNGVKYIFLEMLPKELVETMKIVFPGGGRVLSLSSQMPLRFQMLARLIIKAKERGIQIVAIDTDQFKLISDYDEKYEKRDTQMVAQIRSVAGFDSYVVLTGFMHAAGLKGKLGDIPVCAVLPGPSRQLVSEPLLCKQMLQRYFDQYVTQKVIPCIRHDRPDISFGEIQREIEMAKEKLSPRTEVINRIVFWSIDSGIGRTAFFVGAAALAMVSYYCFLS